MIVTLQHQELHVSEVRQILLLPCGLVGLRSSMSFKQFRSSPPPPCGVVSAVSPKTVSIMFCRKHSDLLLPPDVWAAGFLQSLSPFLPRHSPVVWVVGKIHDPFSGWHFGGLQHQKQRQFADREQDTCPPAPPVVRWVCFLPKLSAFSFAKTVRPPPSV